MGRVIQVRNLTLGEGLPKICVPLTDTDYNRLIFSARNIQNSPLDFVEWRADFYADLCSDAERTKALTALREILGEIPILFTIRTRQEGGQADLTAGEYERINRSVIESRLADLVDVELSKGDDVMIRLAAAAHGISDGAGTAIVGSRHDFERTPDEEEIVRSLCRMQDLGADLVKFAVMPESERDVLTLLSATLTMKEQHSGTPFITMSMGRSGVLSRISGSLTGSAVTFGTAGNASAPGQIPASELKSILEILA